jgi:hypothetical protein
LDRDEIEQALCNIWKDFLAVEVGPSDDFFELGGYSLLVVNIVAEAQHQHIMITPDHVFRYKTPERITKALLDGESDNTPISGHDLAAFWLTGPASRADASED